MLVQVLKPTPSLEVRDEAGQGKGKGVFTQKVHTQRRTPCSWQRLIAGVVQNFQADQTILNEPPLVAGQHAANKQVALVCSHCFQFLGGIELQLAWCKYASGYDGKHCLLYVNQLHATTNCQG